MFHISHNAFATPAYPIHISSSNQPQARRRSAHIDNQLFRHTFSDDLLGSRSATPVSDPAEQARQRLLLAIEEQKAARKAYADLVAERELARLEAAAEQPRLATLNSHDFFASDNFDLDYGNLLQRQQQRAALQQQQREQAILRKRQEELVRAQRQKAAEEAALRREQQLEAARLRHLAVLRQEKIEALRQQKLQALRQQQLAAVRRQQEAEQQHRQQLVAEAYRQRQLEQARRQHQLCYHQEAIRRHQVEQQQKSSSDDELSQAIALAVSIAQQFFTNESNETKESPNSAPVPALAEPTRRVRFASAPNVAPAATSVPSSSKPTSVPAKPTAGPHIAPTMPTIRIPIRDAKGKAAAHVRVNSSPAPAPSSPATTATPADSIAALTILASDLDVYLAPEHEWHSDAHRRHALNQLLEQIDAVESGGEEAVRDVRRALVRRVERALEGLPEEEAVKAKGIVISEPSIEVSLVSPVIAPTAVAPALAPVVLSEVEGYEVPDFLEATPAVSSSTIEDSHEVPAAPALANDVALPETTPLLAYQPEWSTIDPTVPVASSPVITFPDEDTFLVPETTTNAPQLSLGEPISANAPQLDLGEPASIQPLEDTATKTDDAVISAFEVVDRAPAQTETSAPVQPTAKHDSLSDWESTGSDVEQ